MSLRRNPLAGTKLGLGDYRDQVWSRMMDKKSNFH